MKTETKIWLTIAFMFVLLAVGLASQAMAQDGVKVCTNYNTDPIRVVIVAKSAMCPAGYV
jgi:hypothetical protein